MKGLKRSLNTEDEESRLSKLLFTKKQNLINKLKPSYEENEDIDKKPAWIDDDDNCSASNVLPKIKSDDLYVNKLKQKYTTIIGTPNWAKLNKAKDDCGEDLLRKVGHLQKNKSEGKFSSKHLEYKLLPKINIETMTEGPLINCIEFHPTMSVSLVSGQSGVVSLFSIGGEKNNKLHSFKLDKWCVTSAHFTPDGTEAFIASKFNHKYCVYNLEKAQPKLIQLPQIAKRPVIFELSPNGKFLACSDCFEEVYLIDAASKELIRVLKNNTKVASVCFSSESDQIYCYGEQGIVTIWDLSTFKSLKKFYDSGCVTASTVACSPCGRLLATGSGEGIVNIYNTSDMVTSEPQPIKTISNLTTKITSLKFNCTTGILAASSAYYPNAVKLIHIPSYHAFANYPKQTFNYNHVQKVSFSPNSGYMALGNNKGVAYLHRLKHYSNY